MPPSSYLLDRNLIAHLNYSSIKAVTFDAAHTLFHPYPSVGAIYREVMLEHDLDYKIEELETGFKRAFSNIHKDKTILDGEQRERSYWHSVVEESIRTLTPKPSNFETLFNDLWETFAHGKRWKPAEGAIETLTALKERGYCIALLTNWDSRVRTVLEEKGFDSSFDHLFISSEIGHEKPDLGIFHHAEDALKFGPHEILHIGDSLQHDIEGALAAGWHAIRITNEVDLAQNSCPNITKLSGLLALLS